MGDRLGGHIVQGHVDGLGTIRRHAGMPIAARLIDVSFPLPLLDLVVLHGSIAIDGVSLTVNALPSPETVQVAIIDYTLRHTTLGALAAGDHVHVEADIVAKHVQRLMAPFSAGMIS